jgi:dipeptidyl-peptidase III
MEECRAEAVGLYLCVLPEVAAIFGLSDAEASDAAYVNWLNMARAGLLALQFFTPGAGPAGGTWGQAHMEARHALLRVMLEAGLVTLHGAPAAGMTLSLDRGKITTVGVPAVGAFLRRLQAFKSTGAAEAGKRWYDGYTRVTAAEVGVNWLAVRDVVIADRKPRQLLVQPVLEPLGASGDAAGRFADAVLARSRVVGGADGADGAAAAEGGAQVRLFPADVAGVLESFVVRAAREGWW